jgi:regulatory protein
MAASKAPDTDAVQVALTLLKARARSQAELANRLERKGFTSEQIAEAMERLRGWGYVNDERFAKDRATSLLQSGRLAPKAVAHRLRANGLTEGEANQAARAAADQLAFDPRGAAIELLKKRGLTGELDPKQKAKAARLLQSRGFDEDTVQSLLGSED